MSSTRTPPSLKWLINKRARLLGQIYDIETYSADLINYTKEQLDAACRRVDALKLSYEAHVAREKSLPKLKNKLEAINIALEMHEIQIDKNLINPIKPTSSRAKETGIPWGGLTRSIYECLRLTGKPTTTREVAFFVMKKYSIENTHNNFTVMSIATRKRMCALSSKGKLLRLHDLKTSEEGIWQIPSRNIKP